MSCWSKYWDGPCLLMIRFPAWVAEPMSFYTHTNESTPESTWQTVQPCLIRTGEFCWPVLLATQCCKIMQFEPNRIDLESKVNLLCLKVFVLRSLKAPIIYRFVNVCQLVAHVSLIIVCTLSESCLGNRKLSICNAFISSCLMHIV